MKNLLDDDLFNLDKELDLNDPDINLEVYKAVVNIRLKDAQTRAITLKSSVARGELLPRELVQTTIFGYIEFLSTRLFDLCEQQADKIIAISRRDVDDVRPRLIKILREEHARAIQDTKRSIITALGVDNSDV